MAQHVRVKTGGYDWRVRDFVIRLAVLFSFLIPSASDRSIVAAFAHQSESSGSAQGEKDALPLSTDQPVERELAGGQAHYYRIKVEAGQYLHLVVDQRGIDVVVTLSDSEGKKILEVDNPNGAHGPEPVLMISDKACSCLLEVRSLEKDVPAGRYEVKILDLRLPTPQDRSRHKAERLYVEARQLEASQKAESLNRAIEKYNEAMELFKALEDRDREADALQQISWIYLGTGESRKAVDDLERLLLLRRSLGDRSRELAALHSLGRVYNTIGEKQKALEYYNLALQHPMGERVGNAAILNNIAHIYESLGEKQKAFDYFNKSLTLSRAIGNRGIEASVLANIGHLYESLGEPQKALEYYHQSLPVQRLVGDRVGEAVTLNNIGWVYDGFGERQKALEYYNQTLLLSRNIGDRNTEAIALNNIGMVHDSLGEREKALEFYNQSIALSRADGDRRLEAATTRAIGLVYEALGDWQKALAHYNQALTLSRASGNRVAIAASLFGIAKAEAAQGKLLEARSTIESSLAIVETIRTKVVSPELRSSYFSTAQQFYEFSIKLLMQLHKLHPDQGYDRAALQAAERARARSLLDGLAETRLEIRRGTDPALLERERALRQQLGTKTEQQLRLLNGKHTEQQAAALASEIEALTTKYQEVEAEIRAKSPHYASLTHPQPLNLQEIQQQILDGETLLLEYFLGNHHSYLWVVSSSSIRSYELPKRTEIEEVSLRVKQLLTARSLRKEGESPEQRQTRIAEADASYWTEAARLSRMILEPALSELGSKRLAIVPDGELQDVAFGALPLQPVSSESKITTAKSKVAQNGERVPLIVEHELISLPSASALAFLRKETAGRQPVAKAVAVLADPVFDRTDERIKRSIAIVSRRKEELERGKDESETGTPVSSELSRSLEEVLGDRGAISRLPFSRGEAEAILSLAPKETSLKALDFQANRAMVLSGKLGQYRIVHFATHGLLNKEHPELSGVVLSLVDQAGNPQDGFLQLVDVYNLDLPVEMVVLSACQTGLGKAVRGEGLVGLTRGFMYAGTKRVVASLWGVQDLATAELMKRFYGAMLGAGRMSPAEALRVAQVEMWKQKRWRSPYYWAGFMLYGEW